jgi:hypothetical protein
MSLSKGRNVKLLMTKLEKCTVFLCYPVRKLDHLRDSVTSFSTLGYFRQSITPRPLINTLKYFRFLFRIRRAITEYVFVQRYAA